MFSEWSQKTIPVMGKILTSSRQPSITEALAQFSAGIGAPRIRLMPYPLVFDRTEHDRIAAAARHIVAAQGRLASALMTRCSRADILLQLGLPVAWEPYVDWRQLVDAPHRVARVDLVPLRDGHAICELNFSVGVGGGELHDYYRIFADSFGFPDSDADISPFQNLAHLYRETSARVPTEHLILLDWSSHAALGYPNQYLAHKHLAHSIPRMDIQIHDETSLVSKWRGCSDLSNVLIHRCFTFDDVTVNADIYDDLLQRGARFSNGLEAELLMSKGWLAMLWDARNHHLLEPEQITAIRDLLLPSWSVGDVDRDWLLSNKDHLIFKQKNTYGGKGIVLGSSLPSAALWQLLLDVGLDAWIAQRFVDTPTLKHAVDRDGVYADHRLVLGMYLHGERASGLLVRSGSRSAVINAGSGALAGWAPALTCDQREQLYDSILSER